MAAGVPIVASDIHGYKHVVQRNVQGLLVEPSNHRPWPPRSMPWRATRSCATRWARPAAPRHPSTAWPRVTERIIDFYHEVRDRVGAAPARR